MKKLVLGLILMVTTVATQAQKLRKTYDLYYYDTTRQGKPFIYPTGMGFRNDTLFIELSSPITIVAVRKEVDSTFKYLWLKPLREYYAPVTNHSKIPDSVKKDAIKTDTAKKTKPKEKGKN